MSPIRTSALALAMLLSIVASVAQAGAGPASRIAEALEAFRERYGFPGATAAIALPDGTVLTAATGLADVESGRIMTPGSRMLAASIGKSFVGATVLRLESEKRLSRSDRLADHLGDRSWFADLPNADTITIDHLLHHRSGIPDHVHLPEFQAALAARVAEGAPAFAPEQLVEFITGREALFEAGTSWAYSDTGYILLGLVIEEVAGRPYDAFLQMRFLDPLGLTDTFPSDRPDLPGLAVGYTVPGNPFGLPARTADTAGRLVWDPAIEWTGGGLASTSRDLARWGSALFSGRAMPYAYLDRLLSGEPRGTDAPNSFYGAGVAIRTRTPRGPVYGHGGWIPGYVSSLRHYADHGVSVAFQVNTDAGIVDDGSDLVPELEAALADLAISMAR
jgi:D-alanyl-D-alanine carboxypeptidase